MASQQPDLSQLSCAVVQKIKDREEKRRTALCESQQISNESLQFHGIGEIFGIPEICLQLLCQTTPGKASQGLCPASCVL